MFKYEPREVPDWNFARTNRFTLRNRACELCLSVYSVPIDVTACSKKLFLTAPNRDYPYEGFLALTSDGNWKFLDCLAFGLSRMGEAFMLSPAEASATLGFLNYSYDVRAGNLDVGSLNVLYWLDEQEACLNIDFRLNLFEYDPEVELVAAPLVDIRYMYSGSDPSQHSTSLRVDGSLNIVEVEKDGRMLRVYSPDKDASVKRVDVSHDWFYKLGDGFRVLTPSGVLFRGESRKLLIPALLYVKCPGDGGNILFHAVAREKVSGEVTHASKNLEEAVKVELGKQTLLARIFPLEDDDAQVRSSILARIDAFTRFGMEVILPRTGTRLLIPEAGGWWFRNPWMRDLYLALLQNLKTLECLDGKLQVLRNSISLGMEYFDEPTGRVANSIPSKPSENPSYHSADATLLFFILSGKYLKKKVDEDLASRILKLFMRAFQAYRKASLNLINGPPVISENGLLTCVPWHSWTDSKRAVEVGNLRVEDLPARVPREWQLQELEASGSAKDVWYKFNVPKFYLPEVNALWIHALELMVNLAETSPHAPVGSTFLDDVREVLSSARGSFMEVFWNEEGKFVYDVVTHDLDQRDRTAGSCGVTASSILQDLFQPGKLKLIWDTVQLKLLVYRKTVWLKKYFGRVFPFGVIVKDYGERTYLGDEQYHGAVVWPRDTPFLIRLLARLGEYEAVKGLLVSNLDHQMGEGVIFYNHELFSLPEGKNSSPVKELEGNPVPVKNPVQFWSQWVDPYLAHEI